MTVERIIAAAAKPTGKNKSGHSALYQWMWSNFDTLLPNLLPPRTPNWDEVAAEFAVLVECGEPVHDGTGSAPTATTVRKTWAKVVRDRERIGTGGHLVRRRQHALPKPIVAASTAPQLGVLIDANAGSDSDGFVLQLAGGPKQWKPGERDE